MSVYPRKDGTYVFDFQYKGHRFEGPTGTKSKREAEAFEKNERENAIIKMKTAPATARGSMTWEVACQKFWDEVGTHYTGNYRATVDTALAWLVDTIGKNTLIASIGPEQVNDAVSKRRGMKAQNRGGKLVSNATVNRTSAELIRRVLIRASKVWEQDVPKLGKIVWGSKKRTKKTKVMLSEPQERIRSLADQEETLLFDNMRDDYVPLFRFYLVSGCRLKEAIALRHRHIDWPGGLITLHGKGDKKRLIPITPEIAAILRPLAGHHLDAVFTFVAVHCRKDRRGVKTIKGRRYPVTYSGVKTAWRRFGGKAAKLEDFRLHDLRHTAATRLLSETGNLKLGQLLLGHEDIATTAKYSHVMVKDLATAMEAVEKSRTKSRTDQAQTHLRLVAQGKQ